MEFNTLISQMASQPEIIQNTIVSKPQEATSQQSAAQQKKVPTIVFCLPGREFSRQFLLSWSALLAACLDVGIKIVISQEYSSVVHFARAKCLGGDVLRGSEQKPFAGELDYDFIMWIDSDIVFKPDDFFNLLRSPHPVTAGYYVMEDNKHVASVKNWDIEFFKKNSSFEFMTPEQCQKYAESNKENPYLPVSYTGMGWMLIRRGVVESIKYPWFYRPIESIAPGVTDMNSEDVAFCKNLQDCGIQIMLDTRIRVGHLKHQIL